MVKEKKTIQWSALVLALMAIGLGVPDMLPDGDNYYCAERPELGITQCDNFTKYVSQNGKCVRNEDTNLICRKGWLLIEPDTILPEEDTTYYESKHKVKVKKTKKWEPGQEITEYECYDDIAFSMEACVAAANEAKI